MIPLHFALSPGKSPPCVSCSHLGRIPRHVCTVGLRVSDRNDSDLVFGCDSITLGFSVSKGQRDPGTKVNVKFPTFDPSHLSAWGGAGSGSGPESCTNLNYILKPRQDTLFPTGSIYVCDLSNGIWLCVCFPFFWLFSFGQVNLQTFSRE